jgi:adenine deaminase
MNAKKSGVRIGSASMLPPARAVRHARLIPAWHYGLIDRGAVARGYRADLAVVDEPNHFNVRMVIIIRRNHRGA